MIGAAKGFMRPPRKPPVIRHCTQSVVRSVDATWCTCQWCRYEPKLVDPQLSRARNCWVYVWYGPRLVPWPTGHHQLSCRAESLGLADRTRRLYPWPAAATLTAGAVLTVPQGCADWVFFYARDAKLARVLAVALPVSVCHKSEFCRNVWTNRAGFGMRASFHPSYTSFYTSF